ncbi:MAG TPA: CoA-binding protein [Natrialbaceae archaeon]|nr:CoA-binding protein [Natrialbaceae archaeon]
MPVTSDDAIRTILSTAETIAVVGCSGTPGKAAHDVPRYMLDHGYEVIPVNPVRDEVLGRQAVDSLSDVEDKVDVVDVFRPSEEVAGIVDETLARDDEPVVWTQLGIRDREATDRAEAAGLTVVEDRCIKVEHARLLG